MFGGIVRFSFELVHLCFSGKYTHRQMEALIGRVDAVLITGGMAHSIRLLAAVEAAVGWIAPFVTYPGEDELQALAEGVLRVLCGEEPAREYGAAPGSTNCE